MNDLWYVGLNGQQQGPLSTQQLTEQIRTGVVGMTAYVYGQQLPAWTPISQVPQFAQVFAASATPPPAPPPAQAAPVTADQIDFTISGAEMQFVEIVLDPKEAAIAMPGVVFYMEAGIRVEPSSTISTYPNVGTERQRVAFSPIKPGKVIPIDLRQYSNALLVRTGSFLCAAKGISLGAPADHYQKMVGQGLAFLHASGTIVIRELAASETLHVDASCVVALEQRVTHVEQAGVTALTGPGKIWLQSLRH